MAVIYYASDYAYGINQTVEAGIVVSGTTATGAGTVTVNKPTITLFQGRLASVYNTNAPITIGNGANAETVTPSAVSNNYPQGQTAITATFSNIHGSGCLISSGTAGLQEALNDCSTRTGGGVVYVDGLWTLFGGTNAMLAAATIPTGVSIADNRGSSVGGGTIGPGIALSASGAVPVVGGYYVITKSSAAAVLTLAAPTAAQNGMVMTFTSRTSQAHTLTATGLLNNGTTGGPHNVATFGAFPGAGITLVADNLTWNVLYSVVCPIT